jgi:hypothetical protein
MKTGSLSSSVVAQNASVMLRWRPCMGCQYRGPLALVVATAVLPVGRTVTRSLGPVCEMVIGDGRRVRCRLCGRRAVGSESVCLGTVRERLGAYWHSKSLPSCNGITRLSRWGRFAWSRHFGGQRSPRDRGAAAS